MKSMILLVLAVWIGSIFIHCTPSSSRIMTENNEAYTWSKLADSSGWPGSYNFQMVVFRDTLWVLHTDGNWYSPDGINWTKSILPNAIGNLAFLDYVVFKDQVLGLGHVEGNIEGYEFKTIVSSTSNMKTWSVNSETNLPKIVFYHPFEFRNKLWIIGGDDGRVANADIWSSEDGFLWTKLNITLPFGNRSGSQFVILRDSLFLIDNDVWSSVDAIHWEKVTQELIPGEIIFGHHALVFDDKIWLLGCNRNGKFLSEVLMSPDGKTWTALTAPWSPRGAVAACSFKNKIFLTGGKYGGWPDQPEFVYSNDLWVMEK